MPAMKHGLSGRALTLAWLAGACLCVAASTSSELNGRPPEVFLPVGISGVVYVSSGYLIARRRPANRIGYLMILIGAVPAAFVVARYLIPASEVVNNPSGSISSLLLAFVLLAFPSGYLAGRPERVTLTAAAAFFALYALAVVVTLEPSAHGVSRCPPCAPNPFRLTDLSAYRAIQPIGEIGALVTALAVSVLAARRWYRARGAARRVLAPVLFGGIVTAVGFISSSLAFLTGFAPDLTGQLLLMLRILVPIGLAVTFIRVYAARGAVAGAVVQLGASPSAEGLEVSLRRALGDPDLVVARWSETGGIYLDREGHPLDIDGLDPTRSVLRLERDGQALAAIVHDAALEIDPALVRTVADAVRFAFDTTDLRDRLRASGGDVADLPRGEVTFLFGDLEGSTELLSRLGAAYAEVLAELRRTVREAADHHEGRVVDARADECFLAFADPPRAVAAAVEIQRRLREATWPNGETPRLRIGLHLGTPDMTPDGYVGIDVHRAARVMSAANGDQILASGPLGRAAAGHLPDGVSVVLLGDFILKGISEPETLYRIADRGPVVETPPRAEPADTKT